MGEGRIVEYVNQELKYIKKNLKKKRTLDNLP